MYTHVVADVSLTEREVVEPNSLDTTKCDNQENDYVYRR